MDGRHEDPWRHLGSESGSGSGGDIAELIRQVGTADGGELRDALDQLGAELGGEGVLRPAVEPAVPLLVEMVRGDLAARPAPVLRMLARLVPPPGERDLRAEADQGYAGAPPSIDPLRPVVRGLLAAQLTGLLRLFRDPDPQLRAAAARLVAGLPEGAAASLPALVRAADRESDPVARASLVLAVAALYRDAPDAPGGDGPGPVAWLEARLADTEDPLVRAAAAVGAAWLGGAPDRVRPVLRAAAAQPPPGLDEGFPWAECGPDEFLAAALPDDRSFAVELVHAAVSGVDAQRRHEAVCAGKEVMRRWRAAPPAVVAVLAPLATDPAPRVRQHAVQTLAFAGAATGLVGDLLARLVEAAEPRDRDEALPAVADSARYGLARLGDPRCLPGLRRALAGESADWLAESLAGMAGYADALLPDVDRALAADVDPARRTAVVSGLRAWGARAAPLAGTLLRLTDDPQWTDAPGGLPGVLGALGPRAEPAVPYLRALLRHDLPGVRAVAAVALWRVTGDPGPTLEALAAQLADGDPGPYLAADAAERLGPAARPLADELGGLLDPQTVDCRTRVAAARALLPAVGPTSAVRATLIGAAGPDEPGVRAIQALARIGPPAAEVLPVLRPMAFSERRIPNCNGDLAVLRDEGWQRLARLALARISPGGGGAG